MKIEEEISEEVKVIVNFCDKKKLITFITTRAVKNPENHYMLILLSVKTIPL